MTYQVLARKWRPRTFQQLVGQSHVVQALVNGLDQDRLHHAFLLTGTRGVGKTTIARILAKCLNCEQGVSSNPCGVCGSCVDIDEGRFVDMLEIDAASRTGVDDTRELLESVQYTPTRGRYKVYIVDEVHMLSNSSFNALLKTLEEPPPHVKFVLATTDPEKIPVTILSRCLQFNLKRLLPEQIRGNLAKIVEAEGLEADPEALSGLARAADGSMRDGLSLLDQAIAFGGGRVTLQHVQAMLGTVDRDHLFAMLQALAAGDSRRLMVIVEELASESRDLESVLLSLAESLHRVCLLHAIPEYRDEERSDWDRIEEIARRLPVEDAQLYYQVAVRGRGDLGLAPDPRTGLEMTLLRMLAFRPAVEAGQESPAGGGSRPAAGGESTLDPGSRTRRSARQAPFDASVKATPETPIAGPAASTQARDGGGGAKEGLLDHSPAPVNNVQWIELIQRLELTGQVRELARNLHFRKCDKGFWEFAIAPSLRHLGSSRCVDSLGQSISKHCGHPVSIHLVDDENPELLTVATVEQQRVVSRKSEAERSIENDPTVRELRRDFGARVHEESIQPLQ